MIFKIFRLNIVLRLVLILLLGYGAIFIWLSTPFWLVTFWMILGVIILSVNLISYVEHSNKELIIFLESLKQSDFSLSYTNKNKRGEDRLYLAFSGITDALRRLSFEKEANHLYLQTIVEHTNMALICYDQNGKIVLSNAAARKIFEKPRISSIQLIKNNNHKLGEALESCQPGKPQLVKYYQNGVQVALSLQASKFIIKQTSYTLVTFRDINVELEQQEVESWQKLIRVLTHEIMNSVIPITNLTQIINEMITEKKELFTNSHVFTPEELHDISYSLETIEKRSKGLTHFVKDYKKFTQLPQPNLQKLSVHELICGVELLMKTELSAKGIQFQYQPPVEDVTIPGDRELLEQVLINVLQNASEALHDTLLPEICVKINNLNDRVTIDINDNGPGIEEEILEQIFIPFFTTKKKGSGVGLSISRQILNLHGGNLKVSSQKGKGSVFTLELNR